MLAVGAVAVVALRGQDRLAHPLHLVGRDEAEHVGQAREGIDVAVAHAEAAADGDVVAGELVVLHDGDEPEVLRKDVDVVGRAGRRSRS